MENNQLQTTNQLPAPLAELAKKLDQSIISVLGSDNLLGFEKAFLVANAISQLKEFLTPEYMKPIMELQGNKLGFKTDKDKDGGYPEAVVKNCLIEAVLFGLQPYGNQFNIIKGNMYATKEGLGSLLKSMKGLSYDMTPELPRINGSSSATLMNINWTLNGTTQSKKLEIPIKVDNFMGVDAILGKAYRKARKWLYDTITSSEIPEGDAMDTGATVMSSLKNSHLAPIEDKISNAIPVTPMLASSTETKEDTAIEVIKDIDYDAIYKKKDVTNTTQQTKALPNTEPEVEFGEETEKIINEGLDKLINSGNINSNSTKEALTGIAKKVKKVKNEATLKVKKNIEVAPEVPVQETKTEQPVQEPKLETPKQEVTPEAPTQPSAIKAKNVGGFEIEEEPTINPTTLF